MWCQCSRVVTPLTFILTSPSPTPRCWSPQSPLQRPSQGARLPLFAFSQKATTPLAASRLLPNLLPALSCLSLLPRSPQYMGLTSLPWSSRPPTSPPLPCKAPHQGPHRGQMGDWTRGSPPRDPLHPRPPSCRQNPVLVLIQPPQQTCAR